MITGIFHQLATNGSFDFISNENQEELDVDYYLSHSGNKFISNLYNNILEHYPNEDPLIKLSKIIESRYKDKWIRIYNVLVEDQYKPLENYSMVEVETPDLQDHRVTKMDQDLTNETDLNDYGFIPRGSATMRIHVRPTGGSPRANCSRRSTRETAVRVCSGASMMTASS